MRSAQIAGEETVLETICYRQRRHPQRRRWGIFIRVNDLRAGASLVRKRGDTQRATTSGIERRIIVSNNPGRRFSSVPMAT